MWKVSESLSQADWSHPLTFDIHLKICYNKFKIMRRLLLWKRNQSIYGFYWSYQRLIQLAVVGILTPVPSKDALRASQENVGTLSAQQIEDAVNYAHQVSESSHSIFNTILIILSAILVVVAFVFLIRKNLQLANYTYIGYALLAIVGLVHDNMNLQDAMQLIKDDTLRLGMEVMSKVTTIIFIVINCYLLGTSFIKYGVSKKN